MTSLPSVRIHNADAASIPGSNDLVIYLTSHHGGETVHTQAVMSQRVAQVFCGRLMDPDPIEED